ncbi:MAG: hypothetical protein HC851_08075 [Acaryochloris sp. RU_4_1]|nr:hypothetical protein [Acaryochloris sp. RU_4_1]
MEKTPLLISVLMCTTTLFSTNYANAQGVMGPPIIVPMPNPDVCGGYSDSWSANCRRDNNGNMHDGNSGNVYDPYGNPIRQNRRTENTEVSPSSQLTRPQIYRFVDQIVSTAPNPQALRDLSYQVCRNNYRPIIGHRRLTFKETVIFKERLGC